MRGLYTYDYIVLFFLMFWLGFFLLNSIILSILFQFDHWTVNRTVVFAGVDCQFGSAKWQTAQICATVLKLPGEILCFWTLVYRHLSRVKYWQTLILVSNFLSLSMSKGLSLFTSLFNFSISLCMLLLSSLMIGRSLVFLLLSSMKFRSTSSMWMTRGLSVSVFFGIL